MAKKYRIEDAIQAGIGAFSAMLLFFALRAEPLIIDYRIGLIITSVWVYMFYQGSRIPQTNFIMSFLITVFVSGILSLMFNLATQEQLMGLQFFGSTAVVGLWLGLPIALLLDKTNITNLLKRHYVR